MLHRHIRLLAILAASAQLSQAQGANLLRQPATIPYPLATALAAAGGLGTTSEPQILVGSIPEWVAPKMPPPKGAQVLGSAFVNAIVLAVFQIDREPAEAARLFEESFKTAGWIPSPQTAQQLSAGGFRLASQPLRSVILLCNGSQSLTASVMSQRPGVSTVAARFTQASGPATMSCTPGQLPGTFRNPMPWLMLPAEVTDMRQRDCSPTFFQTGNISTAQIKSVGALPAQMDYFAKQLADSGWSRTTGEKSSMTRTFARKDSAGVERRIEITIGRDGVDSTCRQLQMKIDAPRP